MNTFIRQVFVRLFEMTPEEIYQNRLARGVGGSLFVRGTERALRFILAVVLARILGPEEFGYYSYVLSWVAILLIPATFGVPVFVKRELAIAKLQENWEKLRGLQLWSHGVVFLVSVVISLVALMFVKTASFSAPYERQVFIYGFGLLPLLSQLLLFQGLLKGWGNVVVAQVPEAILRPFLSLVLVGAVVLAYPGIEVSAVLMFKLLYPVVFLIFVMAFALNRYLIRLPRIERPRIYHRTWLSGSSRFTLLSGLAILNSRVGIVLLGLLAGPKAVAFFVVALRGAELIAVPTAAAHHALSPRMAAMVQENKKIRLQQLIRRAYRGVAMLTLPAFIVLLLWGDILLRVFGEGFDKAMTALIVLVVAQYAVILLGPAAELLNMARKESLTLMGVVISIAITAGLCFVLIPGMRETGTAIATGAGMVVCALSLSVLSRRELGIWTPLWGDSANRKVQMDS